MRTSLPLLAALLVVPAAAASARPSRAGTGPERCLRVSGAAAQRCLERVTGTLRDCALGDDSAACEAAARADGGALDVALAASEEPVRGACSAADAEPLGYTTDADVVRRVREACADWGDEIEGLSIGGAGSASGALLGCRREAARQLGRLHMAVARLAGDCNLRAFRGEPCRLAKRDRRLVGFAARARTRIARRCKTDFTGLGLGTLDEALDTATDRARHFALQVRPPNDLGPTAALGPYPIGVHTIELADPSRTDVARTGPRPVTVEVFYPSTPEATAGVPRDVAEVLGVAVVQTPAYRDVAVAPGAFPLILFSHGNLGIRIQSFAFCAHLASHGYVVVSPDHHGNTFVDSLLGIADPDVVTNRPRDLSFLIDTFTAPGGPFAASIDAAHIGVSGHSFGGYTAFAVAGGTFRDARVDAILPQAPAALLFDGAFFAGVTVPVLIVGGSLDETTPFPEDQAAPFAALPSGADVVGLARLTGAGHFTFSDFCEVDRDLLGFLGGFDEACEPRHLPWRHAHDIVNSLGLDFFDATLRGDAAARAHLETETGGTVEWLDLQLK